MTVTVRRLLARTDLGLRLLSPLPDRAAPAVHPLDQPITWVAGTDLDDPTPFLTEGNVVLTTGRQFGDAIDADGYVSRLAAFGIRAIGFASGVIRDVPAELVDACEREAMPLFDVPYRTPFIAITRYVADLVTAEAHGRSVWAADAQRTISGAALRDNGLRSSVVELSRQLDRPVTLFDATGDALHAAPAPLDVHADVRRLLERGIPAAAPTDDGILLQTIGRGGELRGVLAVAGPLDHPAQSVVAGVVALAVMALEQRRSLAEASLALRNGAWHCLQDDNLALARHLAGHELPAGDIVVALIAPAAADRVPPDDASRASSPLGAILADPALDGLFTAREGSRIAVLLPAGDESSRDAPVTRDLAVRHGIHIGLSSPATIETVSRAATQAELALSRAAQTGGVARFDEVADAGFDAVLDTEAARSIAYALLRPIAEHDAAHRTALTTSLRTWLEHNGAWDPAASALSIHRHTLRKHILKIAELTGRDLSTARVRAELILALESTQ
ncbi:PucR family transcriptional regulator [Paramicrobacterium agarici]|uniref:Purine catabolism regulator n=1 Tax=Paramicrobacterium agarici TaxID=630514 RepID=A0A2A9DU01_9MICO|nr:PucR family transcriptional regulator [Microbacterium agarici]PFG29390.1 purine catabolism regulator [Microbacterium agarici]